VLWRASFAASYLNVCLFPWFFVCVRARRDQPTPLSSTPVAEARPSVADLIHRFRTGKPMSREDRLGFTEHTAMQGIWGTGSGRRAGDSLGALLASVEPSPAVSTGQFPTRQPVAADGQAFHAAHLPSMRMTTASNGTVQRVAFQNEGPHAPFRSHFARDADEDGPSSHRLASGVTPAAVPDTLRSSIAYNRHTRRDFGTDAGQAWRYVSGDEALELTAGRYDLDRRPLDPPLDDVVEVDDGSSDGELADWNIPHLKETTDELAEQLDFTMMRLTKR
jgi:hypothetical protein